MRYKNYIWDFDGTLFDTYPAMMIALRQTMKQHKVKLDADFDLEDFVKRYSIRKFALDYTSGADFLADFHTLEHELTQDVAYYPAIPEILKTIVAGGGRHFILSHRDDTTYRLLADLLPLFTEIVTSDNAFARKPNPEAINYLVAKYGLVPDETVMIGDRPLDVKAGKNAGVQTILFDDADLFTENDALGADLHIKTWENFTDEN
ncbi:HAD-IA family hydrolase [Pseudolactococcus insecticola]|uniref:Phosphoglycolate phosphatase n=1 Tax=Pseudolactococcus insecticola TaxID=2709158 RepID=A0A6A0B6A9_9LACT|nr:HAD-IA family hydrolase [Lactococcus insecticola]GFH40772.1 phosphoglycolate phosphatase [Lactococcus insecticola]